MDDEGSYVDVGSVPADEEDDDNEDDNDDDEDDDDDDGSFVDEGYQPANINRDQEPSWASSGPALSSIEEPEERMDAVGHWVQQNS